MGYKVVNTLLDTFTHLFSYEYLGGTKKLDTLAGSLEAAVVIGGLQVHPTHTLEAAKGMVICTTCGGVGAFAPKKLTLPCGQLTRAGRRAHAGIPGC